MQSGGIEPPDILKGVTTMKHQAIFLPAGNVCIMQTMRSFRTDLDYYYKVIGCRTVDFVSAYALEGVEGLENINLIVDDEGLFSEQPKVNIIASLLYGYKQHGQPIVGNALIVNTDPETGETLPLTDEQTKQLMDIIPTI